MNPASRFRAAQPAALVQLVHEHGISDEIGAMRERQRRIAKSCARANVVQSFDTVITRMCVFEHNQNKDLWQATDLGNKVYQNRDT